MAKVSVYVLTAFENSDNACEVRNTSVFASLAMAQDVMNSEYQRMLMRLGDDVDGGDYAPTIAERYAQIGANNDYDHYEWEITAHTLEVAQEIRVKTPLGTLVAAATENREYPGISIDLSCVIDGKDEQVPICDVEYGEKLHGKREISIVTHEDMASDDYTRYLQVDSHGKIKAE